MIELLLGRVLGSVCKAQLASVLNEHTTDCVSTLLIVFLLLPILWSFCSCNYSFFHSALYRSPSRPASKKIKTREPGGRDRNCV